MGLANTIGLKAVMDMSGFSAGINEYNKQVNGASTNTDSKANAISKAFSTIGKAAVGLAVGGVAMLTTAIIGGIKVATDWAEVVDSVGDVLGTTAEESSALAVAAEYIGGNVQQLTSQMAILTRGLFDAKGEIGPTGKILQDLGIAFQDANGKMLPTSQILGEVATKIGNMPDGLEKTQLMMDLFGKSGKDMSDMLGVLANGGMEEMNQKAKALGLSMSEDATQGAIQWGRSMNELKLMGKGLLVTLGSELLPILQPIIEQFFKLAQEAVPYVRDAIQAAIPVIRDIFQWLGEKLTPVIQDVVAWMSEHIPPAVEKAVNFFNTYFLPVIKDIWSFIQDPLLPILGEITTWLLDKVGKAIEGAVWYFENIWGPGFAMIWDFVSTKLLPILADIIEWLVNGVKVAITTFTPIWNGILTAFTEVYNFINKDLLKVFGDIVDFLKNGWSGVVETVTRIWDGIKQAIQPVLDIVNDLIRAIQWALELLGILSKSDTPDYGSNKSTEPSGGKRDDGDPEHKQTFGGGLGGGRGGGLGGGQTIISNNNVVNVYLTASINNGMDLAAFQTMIKQTVMGEFA